MEATKFDILWKIGLILVLLLCTGYMGYSLREFTLEGKLCLQQPLIYGAKRFTDQLKDYDSMACSCSLTGKYAITQPYSFSEKGITPEKTGRSTAPPNLNFTGLDKLITK